MSDQDSAFAGMTVNERLFSTNLLSEFDKSIAEKDFEAAKRILKLVDVDDQSVAEILINRGMKGGN
jgi:hypothetical protein